MLDMFTRKDDAITVYLWRMPRADGGPPGSGVLLYDACAVAVAGRVLYDSPPLGQALYPFKIIACLPLAAACLHAYSLFVKITVSETDRDIHLKAPGHSRRLASLDELYGIQVLLQEYRGELHFCYAAVWRGDRLKPPIRLSPICRSMNRLSQFQRIAIPWLRELLPQVPETPGDWWTGKAVSDDDAKERPGRKRVLRASIRKEVLCRVGLVAAGVLILCLIVWLARFGYGDGVTLNIGLYYFNHMMSAGLILVRYVFCAGGALFFARFLSREWLRNVSVVIDGSARRIETRTGFGFVANSYSFDDLAYVSVKGFGEKRHVCLVIEDCPSDIVVRITRSAAETRSAVREVCSILGINPREWVDLLRPIEEWRFNNRYNPYREFDWKAGQGFKT